MLITKGSSIGIIFRLSSTNIFAMLVGIIGTLVQANYVEPDDLGYFRSFAIITGFAFVLNLGTAAAVSRIYPIYIGQGNFKGAKNCIESSKNWSLSISSCISIVFIILSIKELINEDYKGALGWIVQPFTIFGYIYGAHLNALYSSQHRFGVIAKANIYSSIGTLVILPFFQYYSYVSMSIRSILSSVISILYLNYKQKKEYVEKVSYKNIYTLIKDGFPYFISGYIASTLWGTIEMLLILKYYGNTALGLWSIAFMTSELAIKIPQAINAIYVPRILESFGTHGNPRALVRSFYRPIIFGMPLLIFLSIIGVMAAQIIIPIALPKYIEALPSISIYMILMPLTLMELPSTMIQAVDKKHYFIISTIFGLISFLALSSIFIKNDYSFTYIIISSLIGRFMSRVASYYFCLKIVKLN